MSAEQNRSRLEVAKDSRDGMVLITHSCGHAVKHPIVGKYGVRVFIAREEGRVCRSCAELDKKAVNWAKVEAAKAKYRAAIDAAAINLAMLEIVQSSGGELTALELAVLLINHFQNYSKNAWDLCKQAGFNPDEIITLERLVG